jgi:hypothetical protein
MKSEITKYIHTKRINSYPKLHLLLFLHRYPNSGNTSEELAERLYFGNTPQLSEMIEELQDVGLLDCEADTYKLCNNPETQSLLQKFAIAFEDPVERQEIIKHIAYAEYLGQDNGISQARWQ